MGIYLQYSHPRSSKSTVVLVTTQEPPRLLRRQENLNTVGNAKGRVHPNVPPPPLYGKGLLLSFPTLLPLSVPLQKGQWWMGRDKCCRDTSRDREIDSLTVLNPVPSNLLHGEGGSQWLKKKKSCSNVLCCSLQGVQQYMHSCRAKNPLALDSAICFPIYTMYYVGESLDQVIISSSREYQDYLLKSSRSRFRFPGISGKSSGNLKPWQHYVL